MSNKQSEKGLLETKLTIQKIENDEATLALDELSFCIPKKMFPRELVAGDEVVVTVASATEHQRIKDRNARELLNEILNIK